MNCLDFAKIVLALYSLVFLSLDKGNNRARKFIIMILLLMILPQLFLTIDKAKWLFFTPLQYWSLLLGPLLYFYQQASANRPFRKSGYLHLIPALFWYFYIIVIYPDGFLPPDVNRIFGLSSLFSLTLYSLFILVQIRKHNALLRDHVSYRDFYLEMEWLEYIMISLLIITVALGVLIPLNRRMGDLPSPPPQKLNINVLPQPVALLHSLATLSFVFFFSLFSIKQNRITPPVINAPEESKKDDLPSGEDQACFDSIVRYMDESKIYRENEMNLQYLCDAMDLKRNDVSRVINQVSGQNFFHFVNSFRARDFLRAIEEKRYPDFTLLAIGLECGFKSQATFYQAVKREFSQTPSQLAKTLHK